MMEQIKTVITRADSTLVQDAIGALSLMALLVAALHLPGLV